MKRIVLTGCIAAATVVVAAVSSGVEARTKAAGPDRALIVTSVSPSRGQKVMADLSDPGLDSVITVRFSAYVNPNDVIDPQNVVNNLSDNCQVLDPTFARVAGVPYVQQNVFTFDPLMISQPALRQGRYTLVLKSAIRSLHGRRLNDGAGDFITTFSVGTDDGPPVLRRVWPISGQRPIGSHQAVVVTFDEPMNAASARAAVRLEDRTTDPPRSIRARVKLARHGLDVVVTPMSPLGYPPHADLALVIAGQGTSSDASSTLLTDAAGRWFQRDAGVQWAADASVPTLFHSLNGDYDDVSGLFTLTFRTRGFARSVRR